MTDERERTPLQAMDEAIWKGGDVVPDTSEEDLKAFVMGVCNNDIFTDRHMSEHEAQHIGMVFMPLSLGGLSHPHMPKTYLESLGCIWEWNKDAGPRSVNGMPCFFSMRLMNKTDAERAFKAIHEELERRKEIKI
jgi:hypothetical protein